MSSCTVFTQWRRRPPCPADDLRCAGRAGLRDHWANPSFLPSGLGWARRVNIPSPSGLQCLLHAILLRSTPHPPIPHQTMLQLPTDMSQTHQNDRLGRLWSGNSTRHAPLSRACSDSSPHNFEPASRSIEHAPVSACISPARSVQLESRTHSPKEPAIDPGQLTLTEQEQFLTRAGDSCAPVSWWFARCFLLQLLGCYSASRAGSAGLSTRTRHATEAMPFWVLHIGRYEKVLGMLANPAS